MGGEPGEILTYLLSDLLWIVQHLERQKEGVVKNLFPMELLQSSSWKTPLLLVRRSFLWILYRVTS